MSGRGGVRWALASALGGLTIGVLAGAPAVTRAAQQLQVFITNTPADPVPVTGTVSVSGTPQVSVANTSGDPVPVSGTVSVSGTPQVSLANEVVRTAGPGGATPFQVTGEMTLAPGEDTTLEALPMPPGKDLVAQFVAVQGFHFDLFSVITNPVGQPLHQYLLPVSDRLFGSDPFSIGSETVQMRLHNPVVAIHRADTTGPAYVKYLVSGYLVDE